MLRERQIEDAAIAMHYHECNKVSSETWNELSEELREYWRGHARVALNAALVSKVEK